MPLYVVRWHIGPIPTTLLETLILVTAALYALTLLRHRGPLPGRTPLEIPIALFLVAGVIGIVVAPDHRGALGIFRAYLVEPIAIYYIAIAVLGTAAAIESLLVVAGAGAVVFSIIEIATFAHAVVTNTLVPGHAAAAFEINPNSVAIYLEPLIALAAGLVLFGSPRHRWVSATVFSVLILAELATLSRGGVIAVAAMAFIGVITIKTWRIRIAVVAVAALGAIAVWRLPFIGSRLAHTADSFDNRGKIWAATARMLRDHPLFGAGVNAYQRTMAPYIAGDPLMVPEPYPHNIFLTSWSELGLLGMLTFGYILVLLIVLPYRALRSSAGLERALLWGSGTAFVMLLVHGLVDSPYWKNDLSLEFWIFAAVEIVAIRAVRSRPTVNP